MKYYKYKEGKYIREKLNNDKGCSSYRYINLEKPGRKLLVCIKNKEGPQGGKTKAISLLRSEKTKKAKEILKKEKVKIIKMKKKKENKEE